ncbi:3-keto-5-aminohexanoate cleavage protein, partial [Klebsiella pneumoniae]|uniref:3-keto-5-aminohexanoate cleavage protein n=1 Tax=Klebsiella pneumoniae TaxID=573 RepID=UPI001C6966F7|nr:3-keto-5-aminohexanoate cleavage protein [Klebsiella pneumoniae subsp. pneumoniae]
MNREPFITCDVTGGGEFADRSPHVPVTPEEIADSALEAHEAGAAIVHLHVRDPGTRRGSRDLGLYRELVTIIRERNRDVIINLTGGMGGEILFGPAESPFPVTPRTDFVGPAQRMEHIVEL